MHRPATITLKRDLQPIGSSLMESCQVVHEAPRELAYLACRDPDTFLVLDRRKDLMALPMAKKTLQPHSNNDFIADDT